MIRFIDLGSQIGIDETWPRQFAFFSTVTDTFLDFGGCQVWHSWDNFVECWNDTSEIELGRLKSLCPEWVFLVKGNPFNEPTENQESTARL